MIHVRCLLTMIVGLMLMPAAQAQKPYSFIDVPYVEPATVHQKLDLFVPSNTVQPPPLILYIHGGGWLRGDKYDVPPSLVSSGYAVASINCRPSSIEHHPAQLNDCLSAFSWLEKNASKYHYDAENIAVVGVSSGAHLAALMGTAPNPARSRIKCVGDISGPVNLSSIVSQAVLPGQKFFVSDGGHIAIFIGSPPRKNPAAASAASPSTYVNASSAPFFIAHGSADEIVPVQQAVDFNKQLVAAGVKSELMIIPGSHSLQADSWTKPFLTFVSKFLPPPRTAHVENPSQGFVPPYGQTGFAYRHHKHR